NGETDGGGETGEKRRQSNRLYGLDDGGPPIPESLELIQEFGDQMDARRHPDDHQQSRKYRRNNVQLLAEQRHQAEGPHDGERNDYRRQQDGAPRTKRHEEKQ